MNNKNIGKIVKVAGPLVVAENMSGSRMYDVVYVSDKRLMGEIIELKGDQASIQVYEETGGIGVGEPVYPTGESLTVELGPGIIEAIYDGIQRPLDIIYAKTGDFITRGLRVDALDRDKKWEFKPLAKEGDEVSHGNFLGYVDETPLIKHYIMVPANIRGKLKSIKEGSFTIEDTVAVVQTESGLADITMMQKWPVKKARPFCQKLAPEEPLYTGQRVIDTFFPIAKGGTACVPGPFGSGKTVIQHQLAKWAHAEIIVYIGCGERGNEMTDVLLEFPELQDPASGQPLMKRTVLIANTSNMPVAAREASVYTGITIAEYFRDMGYSVALMADSTSRWAEAMREISGRLEEMPGEEGYPAYLSSKIASFYERAGRVKCLSDGKERIGALSVIGAVSPPGGDLSDPVVQATLRVVKVFWSLEASLAYSRHFPAISWINSYSLYVDNLKSHIEEAVGEDFLNLQAESMKILEEESELEEVVRLVGIDALSASDRLTLLVARILREDFLHQNAFHDVDTSASIQKQYQMLKTIHHFNLQAKEYIDRGADINDIENMAVLDRIARMRYIKEDDIGKIEQIKNEIDSEISSLTGE